MCSFGNLVRHSGIKPESAIIAALHIELMAQIVVGLTRSRKSANHRAEFLLAAPQQELHSIESNDAKFCLHLAATQESNLTAYYGQP